MALGEWTGISPIHETVVCEGPIQSWTIMSLPSRALCSGARPTLAARRKIEKWVA
jgi:hypothetical protein